MRNLKMLRGGKRARFSSRIAVKNSAIHTTWDLSYKLPVLKKKCVHETDERGTLGEAWCCSNKTPETLVRRDGLCWLIGLEVLVNSWLAYPFGTCSEVVCVMEKAASLTVARQHKDTQGPRFQYIKDPHPGTTLSLMRPHHQRFHYPPWQSNFQDLNDCG